MQQQQQQQQQLITSSGGRQRRGCGRRASALTRIAVATAAAAIATSGLVGNPAEAAMSNEAVVECNSAYNTIEVTPRVLSDHADSSQWAATRVWVATWNGSSRTWEWGAQPWKVELASAGNSPIATDVSRLATQKVTMGNGYYYIYVESYMWNGTTWYGRDGEFTRTYTQVTPSVSHEPDTRTQGTYCTL